jgi:hypothetical protein
MGGLNSAIASTARETIKDHARKLISAILELFGAAAIAVAVFIIRI